MLDLWARLPSYFPVLLSEVKSNMSLYDGVDIDGVPMQSNSTEGTDITKLCELIYIFVGITLYSRDFMRGKIANF